MRRKNALCNFRFYSSVHPIFSITLCICIFSSCAPSRFVKPLGGKQHAANISLGGPLIKYDKTTIPIPFVTATYGYGFDSLLTGFVSVNITSALYSNVQLELGVVKQLSKQQKAIPAISITPVFNFIYHDRNTKKIYPQLDINAYWEYGRFKNFIYVGVDNWFELSQKRAYEIKQKNHWFFSPMIGHTLVRNKYCINIEAKIIAPNLSNRKLVIDYQTPLKHNGALGVYIGYTRKF